MAFTKTERFIIANQLRVLELLDKPGAREYAKQREAFERGFQMECEEAMERFSDGLSDEEQDEVSETLDMYRALNASFDGLSDKSGIEERMLRFDGFDGNDETECKMLGYVRFLVEVESKFTECTKGHDGHWKYNSHSRVREKYQRMREVWKSHGESHKLSNEQIKQICVASIHPTMRG